VVIHTYPGQYSQVYTPLLGLASFDGPSLQMGDMKKTHAETINWLDKSATANRPWVVCLDEIGPASTGVKTDANDPTHDDVRRYALWGNLMAGGGGVEWYFGYQQPHDDLDCENWRSRDKMWDLTRYALQFFQQHLPFETMRHADGETSRTDDYVLAKLGEIYAVYVPTASATSLKLNGDFTVKWFDPRAGGALVDGTIKTVTGSGGATSIGQPPNNTGKDWVALVVKKGGVTPPADGGVTPPKDAGVPNPDSAPPTLRVTSLTLINADSDQPIGTFDPLLDGDTLNLAFLPTRNLNIRANVAGNAGSVVFGLDGNANFQTESTAPYALAGDTSGDYAAWTPSVGKHTITATPYDAAGGKGTAGQAYSISFTVSDDATAVDAGVPDGLFTPDTGGTPPVADAGVTPPRQDGGVTPPVSDGGGGDSGGQQPKTAEGGCAVVDGAAGGGAKLGLALLLLAFACLRRRR
jgi:MYXO-CTERM domain-containing protein